MSFSDADHRHMSHALRLAQQGRFTTHPNPRVGCVLVKDGKVIGEGYHAYAGGPHAEVEALNEAGDNAKGATAYVTLEPCSHHGKTPPCADALIKAGVTRVVAAMEDPNPEVAGNGLKRLAAHGIDVAAGLMSAEAEALNPGFIKRMREKRPYVRCKLAMSLDGRTAMASGESKWITGPAAREDVQRLRAASSAIITGIGTVLADDPSMNVRIDGTERQPIRVVLDPHLSTPESARILQPPGNVLIATAAEQDDAWERLQADNVEIVHLPHGPDAIDLKALMSLLAANEVNEVLVETGATLSGAVLSSGLIDELIVYTAPKLMGDGARGLFKLPGLESMADAVELAWRDVRMVGNDLRLTMQIVGGNLIDA